MDDKTNLVDLLANIPDLWAELIAMLKPLDIVSVRNWVVLNNKLSATQLNSTKILCYSTQLNS